MATSGQVNTNTEYESYFWVKWEQKSQDVASNKTTISWSCGVTCGHDFKSNAIKMSAVTINGSQVYGGGKYSNFNKGTHTIASGTLEIQHGADGKKTLTIASFTGWLYSNHNYSSSGGSFALTDIPRKATITAASDFTDLQNPSISFSNPGGFTLDVWLEPNPVGEHLCVRNGIPNTGKYTWTLTEAERDELRNHCAGTECPIRLGLYTHIGSTTEAHYKDMKFTIVESDATRPSVSMEITLDNGVLPSTFDDLYIQGKSRLHVKLSAEGKNNADIKSYSAVIDGKTYNSQEFTTDVIQSEGSVKVTGYAKDSREFTGSNEQAKDFIAYAKPQVVNISSENAILCYRSDGNGKRTGNSTSLWVKAKRSYYSLAGKNQCAFEYRSKLVSEEWDDDKHPWEDLIPATSTTDEYNGLISGEYDLKESYAVQIRAKDSLEEHDTKPFEIPTQDVALHLGRGGKNVSIGTYCDYSEERTFYSEWKAIFGGGVCIGDSNTTLKDYILSVINGGG